MIRRVSLGCVMALSFFLLSGCGAAPVKVNGKVVNNGQPYQLSDKGVFIITLYKEDDTANARAFATDTKPDGTFTVMGPDRKGVPPGKYKVVVQAMDPYEKKTDKLQSKFTPTSTKLVVEVAAGKDIVVDVGK